MADVNIKGKIVVDTGDSAPQIDNLKKKLNETGASGKGAQGTFTNLKKELAGVSEGMIGGSKSAGLLTQALSVLKAHPIVGAFILLGGVVLTLFQRFRQMEGVSDSLGKAWASLSTMFEGFTTAILAPMIEGFTSIVEWGTKAAEYIVGLFAPNLAKASKEAGKLAETLDNLEDAEKNNEVARARSMRQMAEAREIAEDANVPIKQRIAALKEAAAIERQLLQESIQNNIEHARAIIAQTALKIGATQQEINMIKAANAAQLERVRIQLASRSDVNQAELNASVEFIKNAEQFGEDLANMERKTQKRITSIQSEERQKRKQAEEQERQKRKSDEQEFSAFLEKEQERRLLMNMTTFDKELYELNKKYAKAYELAKKYGWSTAELDRLKLKDDLEIINKQVTADRVKFDLFETHIKAHLPKRAELNSQITANEQQNANVQMYTAEQMVDFRMKLFEQLAQTMSAFSDLVGKETVAGKALAVAAATVNTFLAATKSLAADYTSFGPYALPAKIAATAATIATGLSAVRNILKTPVPGRGSGGVSMPSTGGLTAPILPQAPAVQTVAVNQDSVNQIGNAARGGTNRAYVVGADINSENERNARIERAARLG